MQKKSISIFILSILLISGQSQIPIQIKSCKIDFVYYAPPLKGTKTIIFTDSGSIFKEIGEQLIDTSNSVGIPKQIIGSRSTYHILIIQTKDSTFSVDLDSMTGTATKRTKLSLDFLPIVGTQMNKIGEDTFLNKKCDIMALRGFKIWYWKGIAVKKELTTEATETVLEYATSIDENYVIKEDEFRIPSGIKMK